LPELDPDVVVNDKYILRGKLNAPEVYADGASQILLGYPMTKIYLHTVISAGDDKELRKVVQVLSLSTATAIELANMILAVAKKSEEFLIPSAEEATAQMQDLLK
jgi:hypothetical protein